MMNTDTTLKETGTPQVQHLFARNELIKTATRNPISKHFGLVTALLCSMKFQMLMVLKVLEFDGSKCSHVAPYHSTEGQG